MAQTEAQLRASKKYHENFDDIKVRVPKGERKVWQDYAAECGQSVNTLIRLCVAEVMYREQEEREAEKKKSEDA